MLRSKQQPNIDDPTEAFIEARLERDKNKFNSHLSKKYTRQMLDAAHKALLNSAKDAFLDKEVAAWLAGIIDEALANRIPVEIMPQAGGIKDTSAIANAKKGAVIYWQATKAGDIKDKKPLKKLTEIFGCKEQTIRDWIKKFPDDLWVSFRPNVLLKKRVEILEMRLKHDGRLIRQISATDKAVIARRKDHG